jgi:ubiquinone/menaquinone biosynthesis C-methylase UbiE/uncharacterized protein YbaR (Trm112 family)
MDGWKVQEIPFEYEPRTDVGTAARLFGFGLPYLKTLRSLWASRNSILAADYDDRAYDSIIPLQRYWQRMRFKHVIELIAGEGPVLDVGCGSSRIIGALPEGSVGVDILLRKLRYGSKFRTPLAQASGFELPFPDESFSCVLCSQVIEHVPKESPVLDELCRTLAPGGRLVLGTPDYDRREWVWIEKLYGWFAPGAYADEHIAHYGYKELVQIFSERGFTLEATRYILHGELILAFRKASSDSRRRPIGARGRGARGTGRRITERLRESRAARGIADQDLAWFSLVVCPKCRGELAHRTAENALDCRSCGLRFPIADGIPVLMLDTAQSLVN